MERYCGPLNSHPVTIIHPAMAGESLVAPCFKAEGSIFIVHGIAYIA
jgi:hypothetical protein